MTIIRIENPFPNVPPPAGAVEVYDWEDRSLAADRPPADHRLPVIRTSTNRVHDESLSR